jgi:hypothetical protein
VLFVYCVPVALEAHKFLSQLKKKRPIIGEDGTEDGWEECVGARLLAMCLASSFFNFSNRYVDYLFPDESGSMASLKILEAARAWKKQKAAAEEGAQ